MRSAPRIDTVCTLIATDARAMGYPPPLYVSIIGESCLGIYTLELVVGCWVDGLQHFKKPEILFDVFTVLGLHQQKFCVSFPRFILNNFFPNRRRGPIGIYVVVWMWHHTYVMGLPGPESCKVLFFFEDSVGRIQFPI